MCRFRLDRFALLLALLLAPLSASAKKVLLIAGPPSHGPGEHEHNAGVLLLQQCLRAVPDLEVAVQLDGWPAAPAVLDSADAVFLFSDGGRKHPALPDDHATAVESLVARGCGLGFLHFAVEPAPDHGEAEFLAWIGGAFEINRSVNPHWTARFTRLADHPITRGVHPFATEDEWYFNLRFASAGVTPLLIATPDVSTLSRPDGPHEGNAAVRVAVAQHAPQTLAWAFVRPDGGRGFGCTGGHFHRNWADPDFRKLVLNAIVWLSGLEVPPDGVQSELTADDLRLHLDPKQPRPPPPPKPIPLDG